MTRKNARSGRRVLRFKLADVSTPEESARLWQEIIEEDPSDLFARWGLLRDAAERGQATESIRHLCAIADAVPSRSDAAHLLQEAAERSLFALTHLSEQIEQWERDSGS